MKNINYEDKINMYNTYNQYDFDIYINSDMLNNKLFATFTTLEEMDNLVNQLNNTYSIMYKKIFILQLSNSDEYILTYNVDQGNVNSIPDNTILVHRKKEYNVLYTINSLNELIKSLNNGVVNPNYRIDWQHYKNTILLTQHNELKQLKTKIHSIVNL
jgi:hypothetical protein